MKYKATPQAKHITSTPTKSYKRHTKKRTVSSDVIPFSQTSNGKRKKRRKIDIAYTQWKEKNR